MAKLFFVEEKDLVKLKTLMDRKVDNEYIVLGTNGTLTDIAQYSAKYMNIHFASVPSFKLDKANELY